MVNRYVKQLMMIFLLIIIPVIAQAGNNIMNLNKIEDTYTNNNLSMGYGWIVHRYKFYATQAGDYTIQVNANRKYIKMKAGKRAWTQQFFRDANGKKKVRQQTFSVQANEWVYLTVWKQDGNQQNRKPLAYSLSIDFAPDGPVHHTISGTIFEDQSADLITDSINNNAGDDRSKNKVSVLLYKDSNSNQILDEDDTLVTETNAGGNGRYSFSVPDGEYFVVVDASTVPKEHTYLGIPLSGSDMADQTYGPKGAFCADATILSKAGACYGGKTKNKLDDLSPISNAEHIALIHLDGDDVSHIDFGFTFKKSDEVTDNNNSQSIDIRVSDGDDDAEESASGSMYLTSSDLELVEEGSTQKVGIRFQHITIPKNATITTAYIQFEVDETNSKNTTLVIAGEDIDDAPTFHSDRHDISYRQKTSATVTWSPEAWTHRGDSDIDQRTPDLKDIVQEIVNRNGWHSGNDIAMIITGEGKRVAKSFNGDSDAAALLHIEYVTDGEGANNDTIVLTGTLRDFHASHPDFQKYDDIFNWSFAGLDEGIVKQQLGPDKKPVFNGPTKSTSSKENFDQWFQDVNGINMSMSYAIHLKKDGDVYVYDSATDPLGNSNTPTGFFPADGKMFGNEGNIHNYHMTYELHSKFTYKGGEIFEFSGDDDVWVFIDNTLVVDIGGVHSAEQKSVVLDDLDLKVGETYDFDMFWAERHTTRSNFKITTSIALEDKPVVNTIVPTCYLMTDNKNAIYTVHPDSTESPLPRTSSQNIMTLLEGEGSAYRAKDGLVYAFDSDDGVTEDIDLYVIDPTNGLQKRLKETLFTGEVEAAEFYIDPVNGKETLYLLSKEHHTKLYAFDPQNDWAIRSGYPKNIYGATDRLASLAIDPRTGTAYATLDYQYDHRAPKLYSLNLSNGETRFLTSLAKNLDAEGLAFGSDNRLYVEDERDGRKLYIVDPVTGEVTPAAILGGSGDFEAISCDGGREFYFLSIADSEIKEGNTGTKEMQFVVSLNKTAKEEIGFDFSVIGISAQNGQDFVVTGSNKGVIHTGESNTTISVSIKGDTIYEADEKFTVRLSNSAATIVDGNATGMILNDDSFTIDAKDLHPNGLENIATKIVNKEIKLHIDISNGAHKVLKNIQVALAHGDANATLTDMHAINYDFEDDDYSQVLDFGKIDKAYKEVFVYFTYEDEHNLTKKVRSSDKFAIRPKNYQASIINPSELVAGKEFKIAIKALDNDSKIVKNYEESASVYALDYNESNISKGCLPQKLTIINKESFKEGEAVVTAKYSDVGILNFTIHEVNQSSMPIEYAKVDQDENRFIENTNVKSTTFSVGKIVIGWKIENGDLSNGYTYFNDFTNTSGYQTTDNMFAIFDLNVTVQNEDSEPLENFTPECYAKDINISVDVLSESNMPLNHIVSEYLDASDIKIATGISKIPDNIDNFHAYKVEKQFFNHGTGIKKAKFNFERDTSEPKNPVKLTFSGLKASIDHAEVQRSDAKSLTFLYARAHIPDQNIVGEQGDATVFYEVYCKDCNRTAYGLDGLHESVDSINWYILETLNETYTDFIVPSDLNGFTSHSGITANYNSYLSAVQRTNFRTLHIETEKSPTSVRVKYKPKKYLVFNPFNVNADQHSFTANFMPKASSWAGKGNIGATIDTQIAPRNNMNIIDW